jgi:hypothetical protein
MIQTAPTIAAPVAIGTDATAGTLTLRVEEAIVADGTATVVNANQQNTEPPEGLSYVLARVTVTNTGPAPATVSETDFPFTGTDGVLRRAPSFLPPDPPLNALIAPGESFSGWTGAHVNDLASVVMLFDPPIQAGERWSAAFALTDGAALPAFDTAGEPTDTGAALEAPAGVGETVRTAVWEVTVNESIDSTTYFEISDYRVRALGSPVPNDINSWQAIGLDLTVRNVSAAPQFFSWSALELIDANGEPWDHLLAMTQPLPPVSVELLPGASVQGWYGIWLQPWATLSLLRFRDSILSDDFRFISLDGTAGAAQQSGTQPEPAEESTPSEPLNLAAGDTAQVGADPLNLRAEASTDGELVDELAPGTELAITGEVVEADGYRWYPVEVVETGEAGFVVEDFLTPAGE